MLMRPFIQTKGYTPYCLTAGLFAMTLQPIALAQENELSLTHLLPKKYSAALGYGLSARPLFGQENVYRESVHVAVSAHWGCYFFEHCSFIFKSGIRDFLRLPGAEYALNVEPSEIRTSVGIGAESALFVPLGLSYEAINANRVYKYKLATQVTNQSEQSAWTESGWKSGIDFWLGIPMYPERVQLNVVVSRILGAQSPEDNIVYSTEFRFEY